MTPTQGMVLGGAGAVVALLFIVAMRVLWRRANWTVLDYLYRHGPQTTLEIYQGIETTISLNTLDETLRALAARGDVQGVYCRQWSPSLHDDTGRVLRSSVATVVKLYSLTVRSDAQR